MLLDIGFISGTRPFFRPPHLRGILDKNLLLGHSNYGNQSSAFDGEGQGPLARGNLHPEQLPKHLPGLSMAVPCDGDSEVKSPCARHLCTQNGYNTDS